MISKELLSEVLCYLVTNSNIDDTQDIWYVNTYINNELLIYDTINIYELAHKCKEWALSKNNLELISAITEEGAYCQIDNIVPSTIRYDINQMDTSCRTVFNSIIFDEDTEHEAIFKACEWILEDKR